RRRVARPPAVYRSFGRAALAASSTTSATTPGSSAVSRAALNCLLTVARASRYSSSCASGSSKFASKCVFVYAGSMTETRIPRGGNAEARVVHEEVDATLRPQQSVHGRCDRFIAGHVEGEHLKCALARGRAAPARAIDLVAGGGEPLRGCLPDAR